MAEHESSALAQLLRAAWENGTGFGASDEPGHVETDDAAFATWLHEHTGELAAALAEFSESVAGAERVRLARAVRGLQGPMAWRRFRMRHRLMTPAPSDDLPRLVRALADEISDGWRDGG